MSGGESASFDNERPPSHLVVNEAMVVEVEVPVVQKIRDSHLITEPRKDRTRFIKAYLGSKANQMWGATEEDPNLRKYSNLQSSDLFVDLTVSDVPYWYEAMYKLAYQVEDESDLDFLAELGYEYWTEEQIASNQLAAAELNTSLTLPMLNRVKKFPSRIPARSLVKHFNGLMPLPDPKGNDWEDTLGLSIIRVPKLALASAICNDFQALAYPLDSAHEYYKEIVKNAKKFLSRLVWQEDPKRIQSIRVGINTYLLGKELQDYIYPHLLKSLELSDKERLALRFVPETENRRHRARSPFSRSVVTNNSSYLPKNLSWSWGDFEVWINPLPRDNSRGENCYAAVTYRHKSGTDLSWKDLGWIIKRKKGLFFNTPRFQNDAVEMSKLESQIKKAESNSEKTRLIRQYLTKFPVDDFAVVTELLPRIGLFFNSYIKPPQTSYLDLADWWRKFIGVEVIREHHTKPYQVVRDCRPKSKKLRTYR